MRDLYEFTVKLAEKAGDNLKKLYYSDFSISYKENDIKNVVTDADIKINDFIVSEIKKIFPDHSIYSEEETGEQSEKGEYIWVIDPIDGTSNFSRHIPHFAVSVGLLKNNEPAVGAVYNPITGELFSFQKNGGAFLNRQKIQVSAETDLKKSFILLHAGRAPENRDWGSNLYKIFLEKAMKVSNLASSSLDICFVAAGRVEAVIYGTLTALDTAPAAGILKEAGGEFVGLSASGDKFSHLKFSKKPQKILAVCNNSIKKEIIKYL
jgi:myo-inositol-1(or 4)-monophosphatase